MKKRKSGQKSITYDIEVCHRYDHIWKLASFCIEPNVLNKNIYLNGELRSQDHTNFLNKIDDNSITLKYFK